MIRKCSIIMLLYVFCCTTSSGVSYSASNKQVVQSSQGDGSSSNVDPDSHSSGVIDDHTLSSMVAAPMPDAPVLGVAEQMKSLLSSSALQESLRGLQADEARFINEAIHLAEIPAPTFDERAKAETYARMLTENGLSDVRIDSTGNVIGVRRGSGDGPTVAVAAHLDTVFPASTNVVVRKVGDTLYGPGLTDDSAALALPLAWLRALNKSGLKTSGDLVIVGTVGEEGNGDLRGIKAFISENKEVDAVVVLEPVPPSVALIMNTGSNRYKVTFKAPGGHSYSAFGQVPSAIHAMGRLVAKIADMQVPVTPRTTFTVGLVSGGTSVNTIAPDAVVEIDVRSNGNAELQSTSRKVLQFVDEAVSEENKRWGTKSLSATTEQIGARPGGMTQPDHPIVSTWMAAAASQGVKPSMLAGASTDAGVPMSNGIPTIVLGFGGTTGGFHSITENWTTVDVAKGMTISYLTTLALLGVEGVSKPTTRAK